MNNMSKAFIDNKINGKGQPVVGIERLGENDIRLAINTNTEECKEGSNLDNKNKQSKYVVAGCIIIMLGACGALNAFINKDISDILLGIGFIIIGLIYFLKTDKN